MTPIDASQISAIGVGQLSADFGSDGGLKWGWAHVNPSLEMAGAGLDQNTGLVPIGAHGVKDARIGTVEIDKNVASVSIPSKRLDVDVTSLAVAQPQKSDGRATGEIGSSPQAFTGKHPSGGVVNQTDQIDFVGHCHKLSPDGLQCEEESGIHDEESSTHSGYSPAKPELSTLQKSGTFYFALTSSVRAIDLLSYL
jgi:hypothetical protein